MEGKLQAAINSINFRKPKKKVREAFKIKNATKLWKKSKRGGGGQRRKSKSPQFKM